MNTDSQSCSASVLPQGQLRSESDHFFTAPVAVYLVADAKKRNVMSGWHLEPSLCLVKGHELCPKRDKLPT